MKMMILQNYKYKVINKAKILHDDKYDYSLLDENINSRSKISIICPIHGIFIQEVRSHISNGSGCPVCANKSISKKISKNYEHFFEKSTKTHNHKYDYSLVNYINSKENVKIICSIHGVFEQTPSNHYKGFGCPKCGNIRISQKLVKTTEQFLIDVKKIHGNKYDYSLVDYKNARIKVKILCPIHGVFEQSPNKHLKNQGCPICKESKGEKTLRNIFITKNIKYITQKRFNKCKDKNNLPFDFYLPEYNMCIEYDGIHHYKSIDYFGGYSNLKYIKKHDLLKTEFCKNNNITLLRINYKDDIENKLFEYGL